MINSILKKDESLEEGRDKHVSSFPVSTSHVLYFQIDLDFQISKILSNFFVS